MLVLQDDGQLVDEDHPALVVEAGTPEHGAVLAVNQVARDTVGWPAYVRQIAEAYQALPSADRAQAVNVGDNYGEASAVDRYGTRYQQLPRVYSGQNQLYSQARPPASATVAIVVGGQGSRAAGLFRSCRMAGRLENGLGVDNEEQGRPIAIGRDPPRRVVGGLAGPPAPRLTGER